MKIFKRSLKKDKCLAIRKKKTLLFGCRKHSLLGLPANEEVSTATRQHQIHPPNKPLIKKKISVFIRNLPFDTTADDLRALISQIVPPQRVILIQDKQGRFRGYAFARFASVEEAENVVEKLNNFLFHNRKLNVELNDSSQNVRKYKKIERATKLSDMVMSRCVSIEFTPSFPFDALKLHEMMSYLLPKSLHFSKVYYDAQKNAWLLQLPTAQSAMALAHSWGTLQIPIKFLSYFITDNNHVDMYSCVQLEVSSCINLDQSSLSQRPKNTNCLIIRNISFKAEKKNIFDLVKAYGIINRFRLAAGDQAKRTKGTQNLPHAGYAFVTFKLRADAESALKGLNQQMFFERKLNVSWSVSKELNETAEGDLPKIPKPNIDHLQNILDGTQPIENDSESLSDESDNSYSTKIANHNFEEEAKRTREQIFQVLNTKKEVKDFENSTANVDLSKKRQPPGHDDLTGNVTSQHCIIESSSKMKKIKTDDTLQGKTIHIRNLPFDVTEEELKNALVKFGDIIYVRILRQAAEQPKTTGFVKFKSPDSVKAVMQQQNDVIKQVGSGKDLHKVIESNLPLEGIGCILRQHRLIFSIALPKAEAKSLEKIFEERQRLKKNAHLANIGYLDEKSLEDQGVSKAEIRRRLEAQKEGNIKLSNPNFIVNPLRLSIRNLPPRVTKVDVRSIIVDYFTEDAGCQTLLSTGCEKLLNRKSLRRRAAEKAIKQLILCYEKNGMEKHPVHSRGFAFVTLKNHQLALRLLHYLNNNAALFGTTRRPIVSFSIEDKRALHHQELKKKNRIKCKPLHSFGKKKAYSRGRRQRDKRRQKHLNTPNQPTK